MPVNVPGSVAAGLAARCAYAKHDDATTGDNTIAGWIPGRPNGMYVSLITSKYAKDMLIYLR